MAKMAQNVRAVPVSTPANAAMETTASKVSVPKVSDAAIRVTDNVLSTTTIVTDLAATTIRSVAISVNVRTTLKALVHKASTMKVTISSAALATMVSTVEATTSSAAVMVNVNRVMVSSAVATVSVPLAMASNEALVSVLTVTANSAVTIPMQNTR